MGSCRMGRVNGAEKAEHENAEWEEETAKDLSLFDEDLLPGASFLEEGDQFTKEEARKEREKADAKAKAKTCKLRANQMIQEFRTPLPIHMISGRGTQQKVQKAQ